MAADACRGQVRPLTCLKGQVIQKQGSVGREMYMVIPLSPSPSFALTLSHQFPANYTLSPPQVIQGEVEVTVNGERLGFLADGSFFGEVSIVLRDYTGNEVQWWGTDPCLLRGGAGDRPVRRLGGADPGSCHRRRTPHDRM